MSDFPQGSGVNPTLSVRQTCNGSTGELLGRYCWIWCPGCNDPHRFIISNEDGTLPKAEVWEWDGNLEAPTFSPSLLCLGSTRCHSFVRAGMWEFLHDSDHDLAGKTVPMVPLPDWLVQE